MAKLPPVFPASSLPWLETVVAFCALVDFVKLSHHECDNMVCKIARLICRTRFPVLGRYENLNEEKENITGNKEKAARPVPSDHPRIAPLPNLKMAEDPAFTAFLSGARGILDDQFEGWFLTSEAEITEPAEGPSSVVRLGIGKEWPTPSKVEVDLESNATGQKEARDAEHGRIEF